MKRNYKGRGSSEESTNSVERMTRVNELLKREIAGAVELFGISSKCGTLVSVTKVICSTTLKEATVYVSLLDASDETLERRVLDLLYDEKSEIQARVAKFVVLKYTPVLHFVIDRNPAEGDRVLALLRELEAKESDEGK